MEMSVYQKFIHLSRYAKEGEKTWEETVGRATKFLGQYGSIDKKIITAIENLDVVPSMRLVASAGVAAEKDNSAIYNCSYLIIKDFFTFSEVMYNLMCRVGVGFSVEIPIIDRLPKLPTKFKKTNGTIVVEDNRIGWCEAYNSLLHHLQRGYIPNISYDKLRKKGTPLKTFQGFASGGEALKGFFSYVIDTFKKASGRKLRPIEVYDIFMECANCVEAGGTQNTALMCLFSLSDDEMFFSKSGEWYKTHPKRRHSNNSVVLNNVGDFKSFPIIWEGCKKGEVGFFNRVKALSGTINVSEWCGLNPCGEIILSPFQFCNLTEAICRPNDKIEDIRLKLKYATKLGVLQSKIDNFRYLRQDWKNNRKLLGVSITGIFDNPLMIDISPTELSSLYTTVSSLASEYGDFDRVTCIKPSGTVSQLAGCSSGINPPLAPYFFRVVRVGTETPIANSLKKAGIRNEADFGNPLKTCFYFPQKAPYYREVSTLEQFSVYKKYAKYYTDNNPSISLYVDNWDETGKMIQSSLGDIVGMAFIDRKLENYKGMQMPITPCSQMEYEDSMAKIPSYIDLTPVKKEQVAECAGNSCII